MYLFNVVFLKMIFCKVSKEKYIYFIKRNEIKLYIMD